MPGTIPNTSHEFPHLNVILLNVHKLCEVGTNIYSLLQSVKSANVIQTITGGSRKADFLALKLTVLLFIEHLFIIKSISLCLTLIVLRVSGLVDFVSPKGSACIDEKGRQSKPCGPNQPF